VTPAAKSILRASLAVHEGHKDKAKFLQHQIDEMEKLEKGPWLKVRGSIYLEYYQAYKIYLRIHQPVKTMTKEIDHSQRAHALLSASGASRWLNCTPSPRLEEGFKEESSEAAEEGTLAHEFAELLLKKQLKIITGREYTKLAKPHTESKYYSDEMLEEVQKHVDYVKQQFAAAKRRDKHAIILIEEKVDITHLIEDGFGTCDVIIIANGTLEVIDLKYGKGLRVSAVENSQLKLYGSGALEAYELIHNIDNVRLTITQPRLDSISPWDISVEDLAQWGQDVVKPKALEAYAGEGKQLTGEWCRFCKASPRCKAQAALAVETAKEEFSDITLLSDEELIDIYKNIPGVADWFSKVSAYLYSEALAGKTWPEHKLVEGRSNRVWVGENQAQIALNLAGFSGNEIFNSKLKGIGDIEKLVGKKNFDTLLGEVVIKPAGKPSLVHESDKRPAMGNSQAESDFADDL
jgi:hypothetical protein